MNTWAIQLLLHFQSERTEDNRFDAFIEDLKMVAARHSITFDDYQSMKLAAADYTIKGCHSCGYLTVNRLDIQPGIENMLPDFWFHIRRGSILSGDLTCDMCQPPLRAT
jgi:hypothetical protein